MNLSIYLWKELLCKHRQFKRHLIKIHGPAEFLAYVLSESFKTLAFFPDIPACFCMFASSPSFLSFYSRIIMFFISRSFFNFWWYFHQQYQLELFRRQISLMLQHHLSHRRTLACSAPIANYFINYVKTSDYVFLLLGRGSSKNLDLLNFLNKSLSEWTFNDFFHLISVDAD